MGQRLAHDVTSGGCARTWEALAPLVSELSSDEQRAVLGRTAERVSGVRCVS
jgi:hypothetical protein